MDDKQVSRAAVAGVISILFGGAIFGFFYAWVCSTMWGLDQVDPRVAIAAMQGMNASVRNAVFAPAFFGTPLVLAVTALLARRARSRRAAVLFLAAALVYAVGGLALTMAVNVPMNEALATQEPATLEQAARIWTDYSERWQLWNQVRTVLSGAGLLLAAIGLRCLRPGAGVPAGESAGRASTRRPPR
jgi:uncharacterized membrane protein